MNPALVLLVASITPATEISEAIADARRLDPATASRTRYMTACDIPDKEVAKHLTVVDYWANSLSRRKDLIPVRRVSKKLVAIDIYAYGWNPETWENLADEEPFFLERIRVVKGDEYQFWLPAWKDDKGKNNAAGYRPYPSPADGEITTIAHWMPELRLAELSLLVGSKVPIVRSDWWLHRSFIQFGRKGTGYYDWLGSPKDRKEFEKLVDFDEKRSQKFDYEVAGIVAFSGVAKFPRQIFRFQAFTGGYWVTKDRLDDNKDNGNPLRALDAKFQHQAEEIYARAPNGLFYYFLCDDKGVRQDSAPDKLGHDKRSTGSDGRIHVGVSCVRCHSEGLKPIDDWTRQTFNPKTGLTLDSSDAKEYERNRKLYLSDLQSDFDSDNVSYAKALFRLTGMKPDAMAKLAGEEYSRYDDMKIFPKGGARQYGLTEDEYMKRLKALYLRELGKIKSNDVVLASHIAGLPIRGADDWEQLQPVIAPVMYARYPKVGGK